MLREVLGLALSRRATWPVLEDIGSSINRRDRKDFCRTVRYSFSRSRTVLPAPSLASGIQGMALRGCRSLQANGFRLSSEAVGLEGAAWGGSQQTLLGVGERGRCGGGGPIAGVDVDPPMGGEWMVGLGAAQHVMWHGMQLNGMQLRVGERNAAEVAEREGKDSLVRVVRRRRLVVGVVRFAADLTKQDSFYRT